MAAKSKLTKEDVRRKRIRTVIAAFAGDDDLGDLLVLKGGNALSLVHGIGERASLDIDYSIEGDIPDREVVRSQIEHALTKEFERCDWHVFEVKMAKNPILQEGHDIRPKWGGWGVKFKCASMDNAKKYAKLPDKLRVCAETIHIDISKHEFVQDADNLQFEGFDLRIYSVAMIVYEKLRALCQQFDEYEPVTNPRARPRDFVDICSVLAQHRENVLSQHHLLDKVFDAKNVPTSYLLRLSETRAFHESGWSREVNQIPDAKSFKFYFDRVIRLVEQLKALGIVKPPSR